MFVEQFASALDNSAQRIEAGQFSHAISECVPKLEEAFTDNFARQATADGVAWPPRKDPRPKHPLLILTSKLVQSVGTQAAGHVERVSDLGLEIGTNLAYAAVHQFGYKGIPARPFLEAGEASLDACEQIIAEAFGETLGL